MTIKEAQEAVDQWIKEYGVRYFSELTNMACLTEEVGELARVIARTYGIIPRSFIGRITPEDTLPGVKDLHARQLLPVKGLRKSDYFPDCKPGMFVEMPVYLGFFAESRLNRTQNRSALFGNKTCGLLAGSRTQGKTAVEGIADLQFEFSSHSV